MKAVINAIFYTIILALPFLNYGCGKTEFKRKLIIKVTDSVYHKPIRDCHIHVKQDNGAEKWIFQQSQLWDGITDNNGIAIYEIKPFENVNASSLYITAGLNCFRNGGGSSYYYTYQFIDQKDLKIGKNYLNFIFPPPGFVNISINNYNPYNDSDEFHIVIANEFYSLECFSADRLMGNNVDTIYKFTVSADKLKIIKWYVIKNNIKTRYEDSIYCKAFDTTYFKINY